MPQLYKNNAGSLLTVAIDDDDTTLTIAEGDASRFASPMAGSWQMLTLQSGDAFEIVRMTARTGNVLTVERARESTTAQSWPLGTVVEARFTAGMAEALLQNAAEGPQAVALNAQATGQGSVGLGQFAYAAADFSVAIGWAPAWVPNAWRIGGPSYCPRDDYSVDSVPKEHFGNDVTVLSPWMCLGNTPPWAASTTYTDGDVVRPTSANGRQYHLWLPSWSYDAQAKPNQIVSGGTQPTWPTTQGDSWSGTYDGNDYEWICVNPTGGVTMPMPADLVFYPSEVGFVCYKHASVTAAPFVSIGVTGNDTLFVNNQQLTGITGANQRQAFTGFNQGVTSGLRFKVVTKATGTDSQFHGRFYVKGTFVQAQG